LQLLNAVRIAPCHEASSNRCDDAGMWEERTHLYSFWLLYFHQDPRGALGLLKKNGARKKLVFFVLFGDLPKKIP
jgi:hypothetical protein